VLAEGAYKTEVVKHFRPDQTVVVLAPAMGTRGVHSGSEISEDSACRRLYEKRFPKETKEAGIIAEAIQAKLFGFAPKHEIAGPASVLSIGFGTAQDRQSVDLVRNFHSARHAPL
jgi:2-methylaconitate cis-trans-isomerase PrpF